MTEPIRFSLNGVATEALCRPDMTVLEWLRGEAVLRGTKEGCAEGDCGACSVLLKRSDAEQFAAANSCIMVMGQVDGAALMTVEGLAAMAMQIVPRTMEVQVQSKEVPGESLRLLRVRAAFRRRNINT